MKYDLLQLPRAKRQLNDLRKSHNPYFESILKAIAELGNDPRPSGVEKLKARPEWRIRVGDYRILYQIDDAKRTVIITAVAHRRDIYR